MPAPKFKVDDPIIFIVNPDDPKTVFSYCTTVARTWPTGTFFASSGNGLFTSKGEPIDVKNRRVVHDTPRNRAEFCPNNIGKSPNEKA